MNGHQPHSDCRPAVPQTHHHIVTPAHTNQQRVPSRRTKATSLSLWLSPQQGGTTCTIRHQPSPPCIHSMPSDVRRLSARTLGDGVALLAGLERGAVGLGGGGHLGQETVGLSHLLNLLDEVSNCTHHQHTKHTPHTMTHVLTRVLRVWDAVMWGRVVATRAARRLRAARPRVPDKLDSG